MLRAPRTRSVLASFTVQNEPAATRRSGVALQKEHRVYETFARKAIGRAEKGKGGGMYETELRRSRTTASEMTRNLSLEPKRRHEPVMPAQATTLCVVRIDW